MQKSVKKHFCSIFRLAFKGLSLTLLRIYRPNAKIFSLITKLYGKSYLS